MARHCFSRLSAMLLGLDVERNKLVARHAKLAQALASAVQPVKHTLVIQSE